MAVINRERFEKITESGKAERYFDRWTGENVSRRWATEATTGMKIEERQSLIREERTKPRFQPGSKTIRTLEQFVRSKGRPVRGEKADDFAELKDNIRSHPKEDWIEDLHEYEPDPDWWDDFDYEDFFDSPGSSK
jgi:hypothetical protein